MSKVVESCCPHCHCQLWIDAESGQVVSHKKVDRKSNQSFDDLLKKEKDKKEHAEERFLAAKVLEEEKRKKAAALFEQTLKSADKE